MTGPSPLSPRESDDDTFRGKVTTVLVPAERAAQMDVLVDRGLRLHDDEPTDRVVLLVPAGLGREARERIWKALGTAPKQSPREFERDQMLAYDGNIARMMEGRA